MTEKHVLRDEFPEFQARLDALLALDPHFARLAGDYAALDEQIRLIDEQVHPTDDPHAEQLKRQRLALKDQIAAVLRG